MPTEPALNVVVYRDPGPADNEIDHYSKGVLERKSVCGTGGGLGYLVLVPSDFDRLWGGVDAGDALGTAFSVLRFLGPGAEQFIGREDDFIYGWVGDDKDEQGRVLLLQIIPRPHMVARRVAQDN
jgi:hypothetical protein